MLCYSAEENQQEYIVIYPMKLTTKLNFGVLIIDLSCHTNVWRLSPFRIISKKYLAYYPYEKVVESRHNVLLKALTMHVSCLFFKPEALSKHSVSLWIGYSETSSDRKAKGL